MCPSIGLARPPHVESTPESEQHVAALAVGQRLRAAREVSGVDARSAGQQIARSPAAIWAYETGRVNPAAWQIERLARVYGVSVEWLQTGVGAGPGSRPPPVAGQPQEPPPAFPSPPPEPAGLAIRPPLQPGAPRRYRLVCPACGKPWAPEDLGRHLVTGDGCHKPHSMEEAQALIAGAKRDIRPWLQELERLDLMIEDIRRRRADQKSKAGRKSFDLALKLVQAQKEKIITVGPEKYEWDEP